NNPTIRSADGIDNVNRNDSVYNKVFPYAGTPHNGRNHEHHSVAGTVTNNRFKNISTRGPVQTGDNVLIGGIIIGGDVNKRVILRGIGPSLTGVTNPLQDPTIEIYQGNTKIGSNDNWKDTDQANITATGLAPTRDAESALIVTLAPGQYTTVLRGKNDTTGNAVIEAYDLD
ncbi:MAG: hypothetical protein M3N12_08340, partial [Verrucomicrobiota bacterium]|nr:hypothetical protein [Verrucomicrobiota bacterium]